MAKEGSVLYLNPQVSYYVEIVGDIWVNILHKMEGIAG
jgi:hypothetical protein